MRASWFETREDALLTMRRTRSTATARWPPISRLPKSAGIAHCPMHSFEYQHQLLGCHHGHGPDPEELKQGTLKVLNVPALRAAIPIAIVYRGNGYLSAAARSLLSIVETSWRHKPSTGGRTPAR